MTLDDIKKMECNFITPDTASKILGCNPQGIRLAARQCPNELHFPTIVIGNRTKIPRLPFIKFMEEYPNV